MEPQQNKKYSIKDSPFYRLRKRKKLAKILRVSESAMQELLVLPDQYKNRWKHKSSDIWLSNPPEYSQVNEYRHIVIPHPRLKIVQSRIKDLFDRLKTPDFLYSPVKGRSYVDNAVHHKDSVAFKFLDVANYFPSCSELSVARFFRGEMECSKDVTAILVGLVTLNGGLPQGSPCSPILAYFCNNRMMGEISKIVESEGCIMSVYADDITISGKVVKEELVWAIKKILHNNGFKTNSGKEGSSINGPVRITGVILKDGLIFSPNNKRKSLAEAIRARRKTNNPEEIKKLGQQIAGRIAQQRQIEGRR